MADRSSFYPNTPTGLVIQSVPLSVGGGDQTPADLPNGFHCSTSGNLVGQLDKDTADRTFPLVAGVYYPYRFRVVRQTGTTAAGLFLYTV